MSDAARLMFWPLAACLLLPGLLDVSDRSDGSDLSDRFLRSRNVEP